MSYCPQCGAYIPNGQAWCSGCGARAVQLQQSCLTPPGIDPSWPQRSKLAAALLAIFLGDLGIHDFYLRHIFAGVMSILFCWTGIPAVVGFVQGIVYLASDDVKWQQKHRVRIS